MTKNKAVLSVLGAGALWGMVGIFVHFLAEKEFDPLQIVALRVSAAPCFLRLDNLAYGYKPVFCFR